MSVTFTVDRQEGSQKQFAKAVWSSLYRVASGHFSCHLLTIELGLDDKSFSLHSLGNLLCPAHGNGQLCPHRLPRLNVLPGSKVVIVADQDAKPPVKNSSQQGQDRIRDVASQSLLVQNLKDLEADAPKARECRSRNCELEDLVLCSSCPAAGSKFAARGFM